MATGQWESLWQGAPDWLRELLVENGISDLTVLANLVADLSEVDVSTAVAQLVARLRGLQQQRGAILLLGIDETEQVRSRDP